MQDNDNFVPFFTGPQIQGAFVCDLLESYEIPFHIHDQSFETSSLIAHGLLESKVTIFVPLKQEGESRRLLDEHLNELPGGVEDGAQEFHREPRKEFGTMSEALGSPEAKGVFRKTGYWLLIVLGITLAIDYFANGGFWKDLF